VSPLYRLMKILFLAIACTVALLQPGCAKDNDKPWRKHETKWYHSDMDNDDRRFFLGSFLEDSH
jgi:hypothetical protein